MKTLWFHIGSPKTGTSALQSFLAANRAKLANQGLMYLTPGPSLTHSNRLSANLRKGSGDDVDQTMENILRGLDPEKDALISSEELYLLSPERVAEFLAPHLLGIDMQIGFICYLRRQDDFLDAFYSQRRKTRKFAGDIMAFHDEFAHQHMDYHAILSRWSETFEGAPIKVRMFEKSSLEGEDICKDLMATLRLSKNMRNYKLSLASNVSPSRDMIDILDLLGESGSFNITRIQRLIERDGYPPLGGGKSFLTTVVSRKIMNIYSDSNKRLSLEWLGGKNFARLSPKAEKVADSKLCPELREALKAVFGAVAATHLSQERPSG